VLLLLARGHEPTRATVGSTLRTGRVCEQGQQSNSGGTKAVLQNLTSRLRLSCQRLRVTEDPEEKP
jgi:hypothetical protein